MVATLTAFERTILEKLVERDGTSPGELALSLNADPNDVLDAVVHLQKVGLVRRRDFDSCQLTAAGRKLVESGHTA